MIKKIAYIITRSDIGGAQNHVASLIDHFSGKYQLVLIAGSNGPLVDSARAKGISVEIIKTLDSLKALAAVKELTIVLRQYKPDLVHTHSSMASLYGRIAARVCGIRTLYTVHGWHFANMTNPIKIAFQVTIEFLARPLTSHWIVVSEFDRELGNKYHLFKRGDISCIPNGVPDLMFSKSKKEAQGLRLVFVGRASYQKNCNAAIDVLERTGSSVTLTMYTSGAGVDKLIKRVEKSSAQTRCEIILDNADAGRYLSNYDLMIVTSRYEGMPLSVLEALCAGLPIISTDVCGMKEVVGERNGYLVPLNSILDMSHFIENLDKDRALLRSMAHASRALYESQFKESIMLESTGAVYTKIFAQ